MGVGYGISFYILATHIFPNYGTTSSYNISPKTYIAKPDSQQMSCVLYAADKESIAQLDIDELYEKDKKRNQKLISCFNKILNRIHNRIRLTTKIKHSDRHIFFVVPEIMFGEPYYDKAHCIAYLTTQLQKINFTPDIFILIHCLFLGNISYRLL